MKNTRSNKLSDFMDKEANWSVKYKFLGIKKTNYLCDFHIHFYNLS